MERMYRIDQDVLDARGIRLSVEEVVGLPTAEYAARLRRLNLSAADAAFVKSLRRRIKNRMASQNSRRRTAEHIRSLATELRAVRASKEDILEERSELAAEHARLAAGLRRLCRHVAEKLKESGEDSELPPAFLSPLPAPRPTSHVFQANFISTLPKHSLTLSQPYVKEESDLISDVKKEKSVFECKLESLVQRSVNHMYKFERHKLDDRDVAADECEKVTSGPESTDGNVAKDLVADMVKLNHFAAELCKPRSLASTTLSSVPPEAIKTTNSTDENCESKNLVTEPVIEERRPKEKKTAFPNIKMFVESYRKRTSVDIFKVPRKDPISSETPKIVRAKCVAVARSDTKEEPNARKPRKRSKETALREAKLATFREIMEATYKEINEAPLKVEADKEKETPFKNFKFLSNVRDIKDSKVTSEISIKDVIDNCIADVKGSFKQTDTSKEVKYSFKDYKDTSSKVKDPLLKEALKTNGCIVHTSDVQYEEGAGGAGGVLNLSLRGARGERRHHGRKQAAPRRIAHGAPPADNQDVVLDLKMKRSE